MTKTQGFRVFSAGALLKHSHLDHLCAEASWRNAALTGIVVAEFDSAFGALRHAPLGRRPI